jgi:endonuclease YncB( thermonuclease family)
MTGRPTRGRRVLVWALLLATQAAGAAPPAREPVGRAGKVVDGDTLWFQPAGGAAEQLVRIEGIDAPELCQDWGPEARQALGERVQNQALTLKPRGKDEFGRVLAHVYVGPLDVGDRLVRDGHAWSMRFRSDRGPYVASERMAHTLKRGLHATPGALQPREFRQRNGPCA